jgi:hypothetical protein
MAMQAIWADSVIYGSISNDLKEDLLERTEVAQHAHEEGNKIGLDEARILEIESNGRHRMHCVLKLHIIQMRI